MPDSPRSESNAGRKGSAGGSLLRATLPALVIALLALWSGTFSGAATFSGATATQIAILGFCGLGKQEIQDPLRIGSRARWLLPLLLGAVGLSWWLSPVARAGRTGLVLLPAFFLIPAASSWCWSTPILRRRGQVALSIVVLLVASVATTAYLCFDSPRAAFPLGHHTLLAGWLVLLLPIVMLSDRDSRLNRWLAITVGTAGTTALVLTGSLLGGLVALAQLIIAIFWCRLSKRWLLVPVLVLVLLLVPRLGRIASGLDASSQTRAVYLKAGLLGIGERPFLGWGPGSTPWTVAEFTTPIPHLNPSSEIIGDLHSLPVQVAYEVGVPTLLISALLVACFFAVRLSELRSEPNQSGKAAMLGLIGAALFSLGAAPVSIPALPVAAAVVAGGALPARRPGRFRWRPFPTAIVALYMIGAAALLFPTAIAHRHYDIARGSGDVGKAIRSLESAIALDPRFPLYQARAAWLAAGQKISQSAALQALRAAELARGLAPLWLEAGYLGHRSDQAWAPRALETAARLDPLSTLVAFHRMASRPSDPAAIDWGTQILTAEPGFAKARFWRNHPELVESIARKSGIRPDTWRIDDTSQIAPLAMVLDKDPSLSFSLYAFRRSPWRGALAPIELVLTYQPTP